MDSENKIGELEERIKLLEEKLNHIVLSDNNTITISSCSFGTVGFHSHQANRDLFHFYDILSFKLNMKWRS